MITHQTCRLKHASELGKPQKNKSSFCCCPVTKPPPPLSGQATKKRTFIFLRLPLDRSVNESLVVGELELFEHLHGSLVKSAQLQM